MTNENTMGQLLDSYDVKRINKGDILNGRVIDVNDKEVTVDIKYAFDGIISREELTAEDKNPLDVVKPDDEFKVVVLSPNDGDGFVKLSRKRALLKEEREEIRKAFKNGEIIKVNVSQEVKGGLVAYYGSIRVFIPASLVSREKIDIKTVVGKELEVKIIELDFNNNKVVASRRVIEEEAYEKKQKELWKELKSGEKRKGIVKNIVKFGAFVDIGGIQGLVHINDLAWERVKRVEDVVKVNDEVCVYVGNIDLENRKVSLILKDVNEEPWTVHGDSIKTGDTLSGKVVRLTSFGAFVEVFSGIEGLVHISEITDENIAKPSDVLKIGQNVKVKVLNVNKDEKKLALSIKDAVEKSNEYLQYVDSEDEGVSLGDLFKDLF
ncbi:30S ribosomal protein S1 [Eubacterium multiforme]|uniref:Small subunit ribosomal protein S1 n=1 Tax=Eubacterium multiforme TaxID=83339 RepID=A0ABT9UPZ6_9FIRM|nr:30S ribosomal protein S1 [Eubacterium multiforme]MDQ0148717.1 small subunit ribosomal protein S1 [Eubacterium multiforme]